MKKMIEEIKNWNFDNGNFICQNSNIEIGLTSDGWDYELILINEIITIQDLDDLMDYAFLF